MLKLAVVMDAIETINYKKDSTLAMLWEAEKRGYELYYIEQRNLFFIKQDVYANCQTLKVFHDSAHWFEFKDDQCLPITEFDVILMRKDPPFNLEYIYTTYLLEHAMKKGVLVINNPQSLRDANEKFFTTWFPNCCPPTLVTRDLNLSRKFFEEQKSIVCKPLDAMGGSSILRLEYPDENASVVFEMISKNGTSTMLLQRYIPEIKEGDKRVLMINGDPIDYVLARIPAIGELRGNLAAGAKGVARRLTDRDRWICRQVGPVLREKGLYFVGLDIIGDFLTEINVTSPTCIREIDEQCGLNVSGTLFDFVEKKLQGKV